MSAKVFEPINAFVTEFLINMNVDSDIIEEWNNYEKDLKELINKIVPTKVKKPKKSKNAPKNPKSAYIFYCQDERPNVKSEMPDLIAKEVLKELGGRWKGTDDDTKEKYKKMAEEDKVRYAEEMKNYDPSEDVEEEQKARKPRAKKVKNAPKNASGPYIFFCKEERENVKKEMPDLTAKEIMTELGKRWKEIKDTDEVEKYKKMAEEDKVRYTEEMKNYIPSDEEEEKTKKPRKQRAKKDKNAPKNVRSVYIFYCEKNRDSIKKKNPELKGKEITAKLSEEWKKIKDTDKAKKYTKMVEADKIRHEKEMEEYTQKKHMEVSEDEEDEELEEEETLEDIIRDFMDNFEGETITKKEIKKFLDDRKVEYTKEELDAAIKKSQK